MHYDLYKLERADWQAGNSHLCLWRSDVRLSALFREFGFPKVKDTLRDLRHLEGAFLTPELLLIPAGKTPQLRPAMYQEPRESRPHLSQPKRPVM